ncbi:MAG TPA: hypothetical protein VN367_11390 [Chlorobaculum sp.]|nr:hypothetical protein [Chlorobaculum sp.]
MANEEKIDTMQSFSFAMKSIADVGVSQINLVSKTIDSLTPAIGAVTQGVSDVVAASIKAFSATAGVATGAVGSVGGTLLNLVGSVAGSVISVAQSGISFALNTVGSIFPARRI